MLFVTHTTMCSEQELWTWATRMFFLFSQEQLSNSNFSFSIATSIFVSCMSSIFEWLINLFVFYYLHSGIARIAMHMIAVTGTCLVAPRNWATGSLNGCWIFIVQQQPSQQVRFWFPFLFYLFFNCNNNNDMCCFFIVPPLEVAQPPIVSDGPLDSCHVLVSHIGSSSIWIQKVKNEVVYINLIEKLFAEHMPLEPLDSEPIIGAMYAVQLSDGRK